MAVQRPARVAVLCGGVGAARLLSGVVQVVAPRAVTAIVNVGDDAVMHGLRVCPDLDTITYTLAGAVDPERGWGLKNESWAAMTQLESYGADAWFRLGDRDLATHLYRTGRLQDGASLCEVTAEIAAAFGVGVRLLPVSEDEVRTRLQLVGGDEVDFQEYFVRHRHAVPVSAVRVVNAETARPAPGVLQTLGEAEALVVAPSNPVISIGPVLAVPGVRDALVRRRTRVVAISPIVDGRALKGPADRLLAELGEEVSVVGVARRLAPVAGTLVIDTADAALAGAVEAVGMACRVAPTVMSTPKRAAALAEVALAEAARGD